MDAARQVDTGEPDGFERLWAPYRMAYVTGEDEPAEGYAEPSGCPFCQAPGADDADSLVVARGDLVYAVLNRYPYNPGHLLICPYRHVGDFTEITDAETAELTAFTKTAMRVIREISRAHGFNLGMNQGSVAGAGIAAHLHQHVVPRWGSDANFFTVIGRTKVLPQLLSDSRVMLAKAWPS